MDTKEFLQLVTADGLRCIAMQAEKGFIQFPADEIDEAVELVKWVDSKQKNAYFALATFKEDFTNAKGKRRVKRKRSNVRHLKALWVDIDYKDCAPATDKGALAAVSAFLKATDFPKPTAMVSSGNGLHLYWPLSSPVRHAEWLPLAQAFKHLCQETGLPADHACTADSARVLRPVGTRNWKDADNPKAVVWVGGSGGTYDIGRLADKLRVVRRDSGVSAKTDDGVLPAHLKRGVAAAGESNGREYTKKHERPQNIKQLFKKCAVFKHALKTKGAEQSEPEWSATLNILAHLDDGAKFVHAMSSGHAGYDADVTMEKWQHKVEAVEEGTGPTLCSTFEDFHPDKCQACPFYKSKRLKTPKSLAYLEDPTPPPSKGQHAIPHLQPVAKFQKGQLPRNYRIGGNNDCIERKMWNEESKSYEWERVLRQVWEVEKASRHIQSKDQEVAVRNMCGTDVNKFTIPSWQFAAPDLGKTIANYGCMITEANEMKEFKRFMSTWIDELRESNQIEDITGQLGWIVDTDDEDHSVIGFACGTTAFYMDGDIREGVVSASGKYKGITDSFKPLGRIEPWKEAAEAIVKQGCDHLIMLLATAFAAPLMRFTEQPGAVVSLVSEDSAAGKSTGLRLAQAVWGNPRHAPATMDDTHTVVKNKLAYLQNLPAYWDEVRGDDQKMQMFVQVAFQVAQGRDRERANSKAETIRAEEWQTLLAACSNESLFDLAAERAAESNAGIYRIFEVKIDATEYPQHDHEIMSLISQLDRNYGNAGLVYSKYLADNYDDIAAEVDATRLALERKTNLQGPERFWIAAITAMVLGAKYAGLAGLVQIDTKRLLAYLLNGLQKLRARAVLGKQRLSPRELVASYAQQHMDGKVVVDQFPMRAGGGQDSVLQGNHSHVRKAMYVEAKDTNMMMVLKSDFKTWLDKSKHLKFNDKLINEFKKDVLMVEKKSQLAAGTTHKLPRAYCLVFDLNEREET